jgi:hypothetical protein
MPIRDEDPDDGGEELRSGLSGGHEGGARHVYEGAVASKGFSGSAAALVTLSNFARILRKDR